MINHFWAFDPSAKAPNGELEVVDWDHGYEESRLSSFIDFLQNQLEVERDRAE